MIEREKKVKIIQNVYPDFSAKQCELLSDNCQEIEYNSGEIIFKENTRTANIYFIVTGLVKIVKEHKNNRTVILDLIKDSTFIGFLSLMANKQYEYSAKAVTECKIFSIQSEFFLYVLGETPGLNAQFISSQSIQGIRIINHLVRIVQKQLPGRVADILLFFHEFYGSLEFVFPMSRKELAEFAGTSKESLIRTLSEFKMDKIIEVKDVVGIKILSVDILKRLSAFG